jgi:hypothetical protein
MKRLVLVLGLVWCLTGTAEAGTIKNLFKYATSPVNCLWNYGQNVLEDTVVFVHCVWGNVNRNPATLQGPVVEL